MPAAIDWTPELMTAIIADIQTGDTLRVTAKKHGISAASILNQVQAHEAFAKQYARAKQIQAEMFADEILTIADTADANTFNVARLQVDSRKWLLSKLLPKVYGDTSKLELSGADGGPLVVKHIASDGE